MVKLPPQSNTISTLLPKIYSSDIGTRVDRGGAGHIRITTITIKDQEESADIPFQIGAEMIFEIDYKASANVKNPQVIIGVYDLMNVGVSRFDTEIAGDLPSALPKSGRIACSQKAHHLPPDGTLST